MPATELPVTEWWKIIQQKLKIEDDGDPGGQTAKAVAKALGIALPLSSSPGVTLSRDKPSPEPSWLIEARKWIGLREIPGPKHAPQILTWWERIKSHFRDDETSWCAAMVGGCLETVGIRSTRSAAARSYASSEHFRRLNGPAQGCIVVFWRESRDGWKGHVAFLVGVAPNGDLFCLGGNQDDQVSVARYSRDRLIGFYWPVNTSQASHRFPVREVGSLAAAKEGKET